MSTRRSTRAASSRGASPAISTSDIPATPRRASSRRSSTALPLPAVGARHSTAYGSNTIPAPNEEDPPVARGFNEVLESQLNPVSLPPPGRATSSVGRASARSRTQNSPEKSFADESGIFQRTGVASSSVSVGEELPNIPETFEPNSDDEDLNTPPVSVDELDRQAERLAMKEMARNLRRNPAVRLNMSGGAVEPLGRLRNWFQDVFFGYVLPLFRFLCSGFLPALGGLLTLYFIYLLTATALSGGRFVDSLPQIIRSPSDMFSPPEVRSFNRRLYALESKVFRLTSHFSDLDPNAVKTVEDILPDFIVVKKDAHGNIIIPDNFWHALRDKIRDDDTFSHGSIDSGKVSSGGHRIHDLEKETKKLWDKYIKGNQAQLTELSDDNTNRNFPHLSSQNHIVSKNMVLQLIHESWEENRSEVRSEMSDMKKKFNHATQQINQLRHDLKDESKAIVKDVLKNFIPSGQLDALAAANLKSNLNYGLSRVNFFSKGTGAVVDIHYTSPRYVFPSQDVWLPKRTMRKFIGNPIPIPNPPDTALMKWEEHGDCWCSPSQGADGFGPSLAVIMGSSIYPDQVVIEHINPTASLEPGAAPREMELLAYIPDIELYRRVTEMSDNLFQDDSAGPLPTGNFVRIATWTFNLDTPENIQGFAVQMNMKALGAHTSKIIVRSKNNWGAGKVDYTCLYRVRVHGEVVATPGLF